MHGSVAAMVGQLVASNVQPALDVVTRQFGTAAAASLKLTIDPKLNCGDDAATALCFALSQPSATSIAIVATSMSELTYGIGYYARFSCGFTVGWAHGGGSFTGDGVSAWPCAGGATALKPTTVARSVLHTFEDNVCTHSYSYVWYDETDWIRHIDWMALQGINVFYALTGQEEIQYKAFKQFGLNDTEIRQFFNGPAFLTWSRGQSMQNVGTAPTALIPGGKGGLPRSWMQSQHALQKRILAYTRPLGIIGVLPAFQGNMPTQIRSLKPHANISKGNATRAGDCAWVSSTDPLFQAVSDAWMKLLIEDFGTDHWYQSDGFFTGAKPPWWYDETLKTSEGGGDDGSFAVSTAAADAVAGFSDPVQPDPQWTPVWKHAWEGMSKTDPQAKWLYQGWAIRGWNDAAGASRLKALYDAVPHGQWIPLDMDVKGIWRYFGNYSFFGAPFIWTTLHNMGGNDGLKGDLRMVAGLPHDALALGASIIGVGATPEGIDQNPPYYEYTFDQAWSTTLQPLSEFWSKYATRRYGLAKSPKATQAWEALGKSIYTHQAGGWHDNTGVQWMPTRVPSPPGSVDNINGHAIDVHGIHTAWQMLVDAGNEAGLDATLPTYNYDVVNIGREVLAQVITQLECNLTVAVMAVDRVGAERFVRPLLDAYLDLDDLVGCDEGFLIGRWIRDAKRWANASDAPLDFYEWQARSQVSTWWPVTPEVAALPGNDNHLPGLDTYANKHWNGLIRDFYRKRVMCYTNRIAIDLPAAVPKPSATCDYDGMAKLTYLRNYPADLPGSDGTHAPPTWPYNVTDAGAAKKWCCEHSDCGGVTAQNSRYEVRAGNTNVKDNSPGLVGSWRKSRPSLNESKITACVVEAELDFTLNRMETSYPTDATPERTLELSAELLAKYQAYFN